MILSLLHWPYEGLMIIILVAFNCILVIFDNKFRHVEILCRAKHLVKQIEGILFYFIFYFEIFKQNYQYFIKYWSIDIYNVSKNFLYCITVAKSICYWKPENYPHLYSPLSPCITLQYTYRDGQMVNLPWALLVAGDIIVIRPGQQAPGYCVPCDVSIFY